MAGIESKMGTPLSEGIPGSIESYLKGKQQNAEKQIITPSVQLPTFNPGKNLFAYSFGLDGKSQVLEQIVNIIRNSEQQNFSDNKTAVQHVKICNDLRVKMRLNNVFLVDTRYGAHVYITDHWEQIERRAVSAFLGFVADFYGVSSNTASQFRYRDDLMKQFETTCYVEIPPIDPSVICINVLNGILDIMQGKLLPHSPDAFFRYVLPFNFDPLALCPKFLKFLEEVLPDATARAVLQEYIGYLFSYGLKLEKFLILFGVGANGKSVVLDIISALLGKDNITCFPLANLCQQDSRYIPMISGKLANICSDISPKLEDSSVLKRMVSGEPITGRPLYRDPVEVTDYGKLIFSLNKMPQTEDHTQGYYRRFLILNFDTKIPKGRQDKNLAKKIIKEELPGILNWAIEGLHRIMANEEFTECQSAEAALEKYRRENNNVELYLEEAALIPDNYLRKEFKIVFEKYKEFCIEGGYKFCRKSNFRNQLEALGFRVEEGGGHKLYVYCTTDIDTTTEAVNEDLGF